MPSIDEWVAGKTVAGVELPPEKVAFYRRMVAPEWRNCVHRGEVIEQRKADLCGLRGQTFPVHACSLHRECVLTRFCQKQPERICWMCDDAAAADGNG